VYTYSEGYEKSSMKPVNSTARAGPVMDLLPGVGRLHCRVSGHFAPSPSSSYSEALLYNDKRLLLADCPALPSNGSFRYVLFALGPWRWIDSGQD
jgi:hypothetical protein